MNAYRVALILCRAVAIALWWMAGVRLISVVIMAIVVLLNIGGTRSLSISPFSLPLPSFVPLVPLVIAAGFLQIFAASLAASMMGGSNFEGDAIAPRRVLDATETDLSRAGAGLFLLFFGATNAVTALFFAASALFFGGFGRGTTAPHAIYNVIVNLTPAVLQCLIGFVLAFSLGLQRMMKSAE